MFNVAVFSNLLRHALKEAFHKEKSLVVRLVEFKNSWKYEKDYLH